ncbi:MAG: hypothetical protein ACM3MI_01990 [Clostridiales bacterium]
MNQKIYNVFNYASLIIVAVLMVLIWLKVFSPAAIYYLLIFMILVFILRIVFRVMLVVNNRKVK